jgi:hypothetical protein
MWHFIKHSSIQMRRIVGAVALVVVLASTLLGAKPAHAATFTWSLGSDTAVPAFNNEDVDAGIASDGTNLWMIYTGGAYRRFKGTTMDDLVEQSTGTLDSSFNKPYGDDAYWLSGLWIDTSTSPATWYTTVHVEFSYGSGGLHFRRIGYATSTDQGATWHYDGDIVTSDQSVNWSDYSNVNYMDAGDGDQKLYIDTTNGYFYMYYYTAWFNISDGHRYETVRAARSPISSKMAAGSWHKFYQGTWNQAGLGGHDSDIFMNADSANVFYDSYLGKYVAIGQKQDFQNAFISTATDLAKQDWTTPQQFSASSRLQWYNYAVDPSTWSRNTVGQSFRLYSASSNVQGASKYMTVTFGTGSTTPMTFMPNYPTDSVPDSNLGWNRSLNPPVGTATYAYNLADGVGGYTNETGTGTWTLTGGTLNGSTSSGQTIDIDTNAPNVANGDFSFTVTPRSGQRFAGLFRYSSASTWAGIYYDNGTFGWLNGPTGWGSLWNQTLSNNTSYTIDIAYSGTNVTVKVNGTQQYSGSLSSIPTGAGQIGFRVWPGTGNSNDDFQYPVLTYTPLSPYTSAFTAGDGGWQDMSEAGTWTVSQNVLTGMTYSSTGQTIAVDTNSPNVANGDFSFTVNPQAGQRFAGLFRYSSASTWAGIYYDNGTFGWINGAGSFGSLWSQTLSNNTSYTIDIAYSGTTVTVKVNGTQQYSGTLTSIPTSAGQAGFRVWAASNQTSFSNIQETF